jgi:hypothetical protein
VLTHGLEIENFAHEPMKKLALFASLLLLLSGCTTTKSYKPNMAAGPAKPPGYPIPIYNEDMRIPRPAS